MTDDQGYGVPGTVGGVIPTPALDRIANVGLRYTPFHSTALCSPTRAAALRGRPVFVYNLLDLESFRWRGLDSLSAGKHTIVFDFKYDGPGPGKGGTGVLSIDGKEVDRKTIPHTIPAVMTMDETFDVGVDTRTSVDFSYEVPFRFTGAIEMEIKR